MHDQPKYEAYEASAFFEDGRAARPQVPGTVARGYLKEDVHLYLGKREGMEASASAEAFVHTFPWAITPERLKRGQEQYNVFCAVCHDRAGFGDGMIVRRGFRRPPSLHIDRLREAPVGHFFDVISNGFGAMPSYADQISAHDRWAVIAYLRALQLSQRVTLADVPAEERRKLETGGTGR